VQVVAISSAEHAGWRWRIVDYAGSMIEESHERFTSISTAVAEGRRRLTQLADQDRGARWPR
jgi:hypothetical protein